MFKLFQENKSIQWIIVQKNNIDFSPVYQRLGNIWNKQQKQLLIDSIFNGFDIPKLYFQYMPLSVAKNSNFSYGVIDGKQRLEAILDFIEGRLSVSDKFKFINEESQAFYKDIAGKTFLEIEQLEPILAARFLQYELSIVFMDTDEPDNITETFVRLNSGINVNTAEKRNAIGGKLSEMIKKLCETSGFFTQKIRLSNNRFTHLDLALKLLMIEMGYEDLSKKTVDKFVEEQKQLPDSCQRALFKLENKLLVLQNSFDKKDTLLSIKSLIITLYSIMEDVPSQYLKSFLSYFEEWRRVNKPQDNDADTNKEIDVTMVDFSRHLQQGADKKISLEARKNIMIQYLNKYLSTL